MTTKAFDCVEMKRRGAAAVYEALKDKSVEEQIAYWRKRSVGMRRWLKSRMKPRRGSSPVRRVTVSRG